MSLTDRDLILGKFSQQGALVRLPIARGFTHAEPSATVETGPAESPPEPEKTEMDKVESRS